jgi:D-alanine-D-alanine ligase
MGTPPTAEELAKLSPRELLDCITSTALDGIDIVFLGLHGEYGEDGVIQSLLDCRGIRYTGSKRGASAAAMDKILTKRLLATAGVPSPQWHSATADLAEDYDFLEEVRSELGEHLIVKPSNQGSTVGVTVIPSGNLDDIRDAILHATQYSTEVLIERFIEGREITVGVLGNEALPIVEIVPDEGFYDYEHKYTKGHTEYLCPAPIDEYQTEFIQSLALAAHAVLGCTAYSRVDFRLDEDGQPYCLEVNTLPGFTETSLVPKAAAAQGISFIEICEKIIELS